MKEQSHYKIQVILWSALYLMLIVAPLLIARWGHQLENRGFWIEFGVSAGFTGISIMCLQFLLTGRFRWVGASFGSDAILQIHRLAGILSYALVLLHVAILLLSDSSYLSFFDPRVNFLRSLALISALICLTVLMITSIWRESLKLPYEWWLLIHGLCSLAVVFIGLVHLLQVGFYVSSVWQQAFWFLMVSISMGLLLYIRLVRPFSLKKLPYKISNVKQEANYVWTIEVSAENHSGMHFKAGQFAWLTLKSSPFTLEQNPFSFSSSDQSPQKMTFTIKELGDFSASIKKLSIDKRVYLDGPYGAFTLNEDPQVAAFLVAGGIGVTPFMSMLRSARDRHDKRDFVLIYANNRSEDMTFQKELEQLQQNLKLKLVYVLSEPGEGWQGEKGYVTEELLENHKLKNARDTEYFVCGPAPVMDIVERTISGWGVPTRKIKSERFQIV